MINQILEAWWHFEVNSTALTNSMDIDPWPCNYVNLINICAKSILYHFGTFQLLFTADVAFTPTAVAIASRHYVAHPDWRTLLTGVARHWFCRKRASFWNPPWRRKLRKMAATWRWKEAPVKFRLLRLVAFTPFVHQFRWTWEGNKYQHIAWQWFGMFSPML